MSPNLIIIKHSELRSVLSRQPPILPGSRPPSTFGRLCLHRHVRDGYGCFPKTHHHRKIVNAMRSRDQKPEARNQIVSSKPISFFFQFPFHLKRAHSKLNREFHKKKSIPITTSILFQKGGDPAAPSDTATLLRLHPSH